MPIEKVITKVRLEEQSSDLSWWLSKTPQDIADISHLQKED